MVLNRPFSQGVDKKRPALILVAEGVAGCPLRIWTFWYMEGIYQKGVSPDELRVLESY